MEFRFIFEQGFRWSIGDGKDVKVRGDRWLAGDGEGKIFLFCFISNGLMIVSIFMDREIL